MNDATEELKNSKIYQECLAEREAKKPKLRLVVTNPQTFKDLGKPL